MTKLEYDNLLRIAQDASQATSGAWRKGNPGDTVVSDRGREEPYTEDISYYGGHLIAESIAEPARTFIARFHPAQVLELLMTIDREQLPDA